MSTVTAPEREAPTRSRKLVEMSWDPITRIVGSLGIYTKIDFANKQIAECHSTSSILIFENVTLNAFSSVRASSSRRLTSSFISFASDQMPFNASW